MTPERYERIGRLFDAALERHFAFQPHIFGQVDFTHSPRPEQRKNLIVADLFARCEWNVIFRQQFGGDLNGRAREEVSGG